ncbi:MAG: FtsW-like cell division membrane protein CA_C0505, partial [uncultured Rubrobacteraceae bacterium]
DPARHAPHDHRPPHNHPGFRDPHLRPGGEQPASHLRRLLRRYHGRALPRRQDLAPPLRCAAAADGDAPDRRRADHDLPPHLRGAGGREPSNHSGRLDPGGERRPRISGALLPRLPEALRLQIPFGPGRRRLRSLDLHAFRLRGQRGAALAADRARHLPALGVRQNRADHLLRRLSGREARPLGGDEQVVHGHTTTGAEVFRTRGARVGGIFRASHLRERPGEQPALLRRARADALRGDRPHRLRNPRRAPLRHRLLRDVHGVLARAVAREHLARPLVRPGRFGFPDLPEHLQHRRRRHKRHGPRRGLLPNHPRSRDGLRLLHHRQRAGAPGVDGPAPRLPDLRVQGHKDSPPRRGRRLQAPRLRANGHVRHADPHNRRRRHQGYPAHRHHPALRLLRRLLGGRQLRPHRLAPGRLREGREALRRRRGGLRGSGGDGL